MRISLIGRYRCRAAFRRAGPHPRLYRVGSLLWVLREPTKCTINAMQFKKGVCNALDTGHPAIIAELKEARRMLSTSRAQLALRILYCTLGSRCGLHVLGEERTCEVAPEPAALVWFLFVLWGDPLGRDSAAMFLYVEQCALLSRLLPVVINGRSRRRTEGNSPWWI